MISEKNSQEHQPASLPRIWLQVQGSIPAFKNSKRAITDSRTGLHRTLTRKDVKARMEEIITSFESQLSLKSRTNADGTLTAYCQPSLIASSTPADDSLNDIPEIHIATEYVPAGEEGADIIIEQIQ